MVGVKSELAESIISPGVETPVRCKGQDVLSACGNISDSVAQETYHRLRLISVVVVLL